MVSFAERLRALPDDDLSILISRRPEAAELARGARPTWFELAAALLRPRAVAYTLSRLDRFCGQVLDLARLEGGRLTPEAARQEGLAPTDLDAAALELRRWGLAATEPDGALAVPDVVTSMVSGPGGLGAPVRQLLGNLNVGELRSVAMRHGLSGTALPARKGEMVESVATVLSSGERVRALLGSAPPRVRDELDALRRAGGTTRSGRAGPAWQTPGWSWRQWGSMRRDPRDAGGWLLDHGIVLPEDEQHISVAVPREIERALRGRVFARWEVSEPALELAPLREERHPADVLVAMDTILEAWRHAAPQALKEGGVPKREIKRAAERIGWSEDDTAALIGLMGAAGSLHEREIVPERRSRSWRRPRVLQSRHAVVEPSADAHRWSELPEAERWLELIRWWLTAVGADAEDAAGSGPSRERLVLELLANIPEGKGASAGSIGAALAWRHPALFPAASEAAALASSVGRGLALLGAGAAVPAIGFSVITRRVLLSGGAVNGDALEDAFPAHAERCVVTADHRVVVSGPPHGELARVLRQVADVVSVRPARVYRITRASLGRALDAGVTAAAMLDVLGRHASEPLPRNVVALIEDTARRHGRLRVGTAGTYVVADDPAQLEAVARDRAVGGARFRRLAPTVAVIEARDRDEVMHALRKAGLMPVADGVAPQADDSKMAYAAAPPAGSKAERRTRRSDRPAALDEAATSRLLMALRSAPVGVDGHAAPAAHGTAVRAALDDAVKRHRRVEIGYRDGSGAVHIMVVSPYYVAGGQVHAHDARRYNSFALELRRILWVDEPRPGEGSAAPEELLDGTYLNDDGDEDDDAALLDLTIDLGEVERPDRRRR